MIDVNKPFNIAEITVYPTTDELSHNGVTIEIKSMAMQLICYFAEHHEEVISRDNLRENVWGNAKAADHTINNHIYSLRQIFAKLDDQTKYFHTVTGHQSGYRLLAPVSQTLEETNNDASINASTTEKPELNQQSTISKTLNHSSYALATLSRKQWMLLSTILLFIFIGIFLLFPEPSYNKISPLTEMSGREQNPTISQDGTLLLFANRTNRASTWELFANRLSPTSEIIEEKKVFSAQTNNDNYVSISPNNKRIAFIRYPQKIRGIYLADFDEKTLSAFNEQLIIPLKNMNLSPAISWLNNEQFFYTATEAIAAPRKVFSYDITQKQSEIISAPPINTYGDFSVVVSPNKQWLAIMRADESFGYNLFLYDLAKKILITTPVKNSDERLNISFSDDSQAVYFIDQQGYLSSYQINEKVIKAISSINYPGYWPIKIRGRNQFILQQDWGLSSLTNQVIKVSNPIKGGDGKSVVAVENGLSIRSITGIADDGLIFASVKANQEIELWKYQDGKSVKLDQFNNQLRYKTALSLDWLKGSNKALLSINDTCMMININTGKDSPLCPAEETLYAGRFSKSGQSIYLSGLHNESPRAVEMGVTGFPFTPIAEMSNANSIQEGEKNQFYYSMDPSFDIYHFNADTGVSEKIIDRTFVIARFSNNDFVVTKNGIYFMDRKQIKQNAIYFYDFESKKTHYVIPSKDNYPHLVLTEDEQFIYLIQSYDNDSKLLLLEAE